MRISDWSSDVCSSDLDEQLRHDDEDVEKPHVDAELCLRQAGGEDRIGHGEHRGPEDADEDLADDQARRIAQHEEAGIADRAADQPDDMGARRADPPRRSEEHTSELQSLMRIPYAVSCLKKK